MSAIDRQENHDNTQMRVRLSNVDPDNQAKRSVELLRTRQAERLAGKQFIVLSILDELLRSSHENNASTALVEAIRKHFSASRVALSLVCDNKSLNLAAVTDQHSVSIASDERVLLLDVMSECLKQEIVVCCDNCSKSSELYAHKSLLNRCEGVSLVTVPLYNATEAVGVLLLEKHAGIAFELASIKLLEHIAAVAGPTLAIRRQADRGSIDHARQQWHKSLESRFVSGRVGMGILLGMLFLISVFATSVPFSHTVSANAELVPQERRLVTAPFDGFIDDLKVEPGAEVAMGQLLAQLEQRELELEVARRDGDIAGAEAEFRLAMASHDRQATAMARARLDRERATRALVDQRLDRIELRAPIAGIIVSGDIADSVGGPVRRGETLFEIAQIDDYEVHVMVHERDIREVYVGQTGTLSLRARPREELDIVVKAVHPVAEMINGVNRFRIRTTLEDPFVITPRPGESGVVKLDAGKTSLIKLWGRPMGQHLTELWWRFYR